MAAAGVPMRTLQGWMDHRDFKTTLIPVMKEGSLSLVAKWVRPEQGQQETQAEGRPARMWAV